MLLLNFSHPITPDQMRDIIEMVGHTDIHVHDIRTQIDNERPLAAQIVTLVDGAPLSSVAWQATPVMVNLPGYAPVAAALLAELHGRMGHFPAMVRLRPQPGSTPVVFQAVEIVNLQRQREEARARR